MQRARREKAPAAAGAFYGFSICVNLKFLCYPVLLFQDSAVLNGSDGLADLVRRENEGETHIPLTERPEAGSGRADDAGFLHEIKAENHAAVISFRDVRPNEHAAMRVGAVPADGAEAAAESISSFLVLHTLLLHGFRGACQGCNSCLLQGQEHAEINLAAQLPEGSNYIRPSNEEADTGSRDVEAF